LRRAIVIETKKCKMCDEYKLLNEFYTQNKTNAKGELYTYYNPKCKDCCIKVQLQWEKENPEKRKHHIKRYNNNPRTIKYQVNKHKEYKRNGTSKYKEWQQNNKDKLKEYSLKRAHKVHEFTQEEWEECKDFFDRKCAYCGISEEYALETQGQRLHKEHVNHDGSNKLDNCVPACRSCNSSKGKKDMESWYRSKGYFSVDKLNKIEEWLKRFDSHHEFDITGKE